jgi:hypothetical protein
MGDATHACRPSQSVPTSGGKRSPVLRVRTDLGEPSETGAGVITWFIRYVRALDEGDDCREREAHHELDQLGIAVSAHSYFWRLRR